MFKRYFSLRRLDLSGQQADQAPALPTYATAVTPAEQGAAHAPAVLARVRLLHVLILGGLTALGPLSTDMFLPALPAVSQALSATIAQTQLALSAGILGMALGQALVGPVSDARGRRWPLLIGMAVFAITSLLCVIAPSVGILIALRFVQGVAGATGIVLALAIARDLYAGNTLARCISLLMAINFLAPMVAPVIGGQLLIFTSWRGVFGALALIGVGLLLTVTFGLGETLPTVRRGRGGVSATFRTFGALLADRRFVGYALTSGFAAAAGIIYISSSPFVLQKIYGLSPLSVSYVFGINALGLALMAQVGAKLVGRVSPQTLLAWGVGANVMAGVVLLGVVLNGVGLAGVLAALFVLVASLGLIFPNSAALALAKVEAGIAGSASALLGVLQFTFGAVVAPLVGLAGAVTATPMATFIATFGLAALATFVVLCRASEPLAQEQPCPQ
ncbi:MAG TPA: multidrug effflux MFS transporter [Caldilineaceae bacterium]|nr:multidrug effflux MFS transporter [Caldilineaceae bacterium]